jgi:hypothetical protein
MASQKQPEISVDPAVLSEISRIVGETNVLAGEPHLGRGPDPMYLQRARTALFESYKETDRDPRLLAAMGFLEIASGNPAAARGYLEEAVKGKVARPRAYVQLARLLYNEAVTRPQGAAGTLSAAQTEPVFALLREAFRQFPEMSSAYELLAETWTRSESAPSPAELARLARAARQMPPRLNFPVFVYQVAELHARYGAVEAAEKLVQWGLELADSEASARLQVSQSRFFEPPPAGFDVRPRLKALAERLRAAKPKTPAP